MLVLQLLVLKHYVTKSISSFNPFQGLEGQEDKGKDLSPIGREPDRGPHNRRLHADASSGACAPVLTATPVSAP
jgi:hypothetical protein